MTCVSLLYLEAFVCYVILTVAVLRRRPRTLLHWSCAVVLVAFVIWSVEDVVHGLAVAPLGMVRLFQNIGVVGWASFASANMAFTLVLTRRRALLKSWLVLLALVLFPVLVVYAMWTGRLGTSFAFGPYGWHIIWARSAWTGLFYGYYTLYTLVALFLVYRFGRTAKRFPEKRQARLIVAAGLTALLLGTTTDVVLSWFPRLGVPALGGVFGLIWAAGLYVAVTRYGLLSVTAQAAADEILATMADALLLLTPEGRVATANNGAASLLRYGAGELRDQPAERFFADPAKFRQALARVGDEVAFTAIELECRSRDGRVIPVSVSSRAMRDRAGETVGSVWVLRDITARREAEERQAQLLAEVEEANEELNSFAHVVSHDLKAPLRAIDSLVKWLVTDYGGRFDDAGKELVGLLLGRVKRMHDLIDGILRYSRAGRIREELVEVDLAEVVPVVIDSLAPPAHVRVTVETPLPRVFTERTRIAEVFQNLLSNAIKYMDKPQGLVRIGCTEEKGKGEMANEAKGEMANEGKGEMANGAKGETANEAGGFWKFYVSDNGPGIEEKDQRRVFQIFQTLRPRDETDSTGVGLAVVKRIVEMYGGRVWVESRVGEGSSFYFTLPKPAAAGRAASSETAGVESANGE